MVVEPTSRKSRESLPVVRAGQLFAQHSHQRATVMISEPTKAQRLACNLLVLDQRRRAAVHGAQWQPRQNNMPVTSVRDIVVHGDDLAIATHGRGFWVMDQMPALRQIAAQGAQIVSSNAYLFQPGETYAIRAGSINGTPMPHEEPQRENPPGGVLAYYWLKAAATQPLKLELVDGAGAVRACAASDTPVRPVDTEALNVQAIWQQPAQPPSAAAGMHRHSLGAPAGRGGGGFGRGAAAPPAPDACTPAGGAANTEIGRASWRERVEISVVAASL